MSFWPVPHPDAALGRPSRKAAAAAISAHVAVLAGEPLRLALSSALGRAKGLGGQERRFAALATRELSRHQRLLDLAARLAGKPPSGWVLREDQAVTRYALWRRLFTEGGAARALAEVKLPGPVRPRSVSDEVLAQLVWAPLGEPEPDSAARHSFPAWLAEAISAAGEDPEAAMAGFNREPLLILRARPPGTRDERRAELLEAGFAARALEEAPDAIALDEAGARIFDSAALKAGRLQVQDLGSQRIVERCRPPAGWKGARIADVCAGACGKAIALADRVGMGRVDAGDASSRRLAEGRTRVRAWGLSNVAFPKPLPLGEAQVVLVDAPCSGAGTLAREPDLKWKLTPGKVAEFARRQLALLEQTAEALAPGAVLVYATCSFLLEEDERVVEAFLRSRPDFVLEGPNLRTWPHRAPGAAFFAARLVKAGALR